MFCDSSGFNAGFWELPLARAAESSNTEPEGC